MNRLFGVAVLLLAMGAAIPARAGDAEDCANGKVLLKTEPARVVAACRRLAESGFASAQNNLGMIYDNGLGVPQDDAEAVKWYRRAAEQGNVSAQNNLGVMYSTGEGVPVDYVQSYMWLSLAAAKDPRVIQNRDRTAAKMTSSQIEQAKALAAAWKPTTGQ